MSALVCRFPLKYRYMLPLGCVVTTRGEEASPGRTAATTCWYVDIE
jgi:hypothetical protein